MKISNIASSNIRTDTRASPVFLADKYSKMIAEGAKSNPNILGKTNKSARNTK
jgi:hypothetical protein